MNYTVSTPDMHPFTTTNLSARFIKFESVDLATDALQVTPHLSGHESGVALTGAARLVGGGSAVAQHVHYA